MMNFREKKLYHQIHPVKLMVDVFTGFYSTYLLWEHEVWYFAWVAILPSVFISLVLIGYVSLDWLKKTGFGKYIACYMTSFIELVRISGQVLMWIGGWYHSFLLIGVGFLIIVLGWCNGLVVRKMNS